LHHCERFGNRTPILWRRPVSAHGNGEAFARIRRHLLITDR